LKKLLQRSTAQEAFCTADHNDGWSIRIRCFFHVIRASLSTA
jgi:hypothetical protein